VDSESFHSRGLQQSLFDDTIITQLHPVAKTLGRLMDGWMV